MQIFTLWGGWWGDYLCTTQIVRGLQVLGGLVFCILGLFSHRFTRTCHHKVYPTTTNKTNKTITTVLNCFFRKAIDGNKRADQSIIKYYFSTRKTLRPVSKLRDCKRIHHDVISNISKLYRPKHG